MEAQTYMNMKAKECSFLRVDMSRMNPVETCCKPKDDEDDRVKCNLCKGDQKLLARKVAGEYEGKEFTCMDAQEAATKDAKMCRMVRGEHSRKCCGRRGKKESKKERKQQMKKKAKKKIWKAEVAKGRNIEHKRDLNVSPERIKRKAQSMMKRWNRKQREKKQRED